MPVTVDQDGRIIGPAPRRPGLGAYSVGAALWETLHPEQVQAEYAAAGAPVPSKIAIIVGNAPAFTPANTLSYAYENFGQTVDTAAAAGQDLADAGAAAADALKGAGTMVLVGLGLVVAIELLSRLPNERGRGG